MYEPYKKLNELPRETKFTYDNLVNTAGKFHVLNENGKSKYAVEGNNYRSIFGGSNSEKDDFIYLRKRNSYPQVQQGLKFHVSVDPEQMTAAWDIIQDILVKHGVPDTKFANPY